VVKQIIAMNKNKILIVFGTRPEAIKLAPVIYALKKLKSLECDVCVTGQHREMLDQVLDTFQIIPDSDLQLMQANQSVPSFAARALDAVSLYLQRSRPNLILVQGDTTTVLATALAGFYQKTPVGHIEAGLRTGDMYSPWPEEANRVLTSRIASLHFAPTERSVQNLLREGVDPSIIHQTGNTGIDALFMTLAAIESGHLKVNQKLEDEIEKYSKNFILITAHRRENFGSRLEQLCEAITSIALRYPELLLIFPVHPNPNVRETVCRYFGTITQAKIQNVHLSEPLQYAHFVHLLNRCRLIISDSGGIQEEAAAIGKRVLIARESTERPEAAETGWGKIVGVDKEIILNEITKCLNADRSLFPSAGSTCFGDGKASGRIATICENYLNKQ
jgi:UDP-N-acetylglucosamine 2-epimerase (non-hydrolysing)